MNTEFDPEATEVVWRSGIPFTFITGECTGRCELLPHHMERLREAAERLDSDYHRFLWGTTTPWCEYNVRLRNVTADGKGIDESFSELGEGKKLGAGAAMHDPLTLAAVFEPSLFRFTTMNCDVGKFHAGDYPYLSAVRAPQLPVKVAVDVDESRFMEMFVSRLCGELLPPPAADSHRQPTAKM